MAQVGVYSPGLLALARRLIDTANIELSPGEPRWAADFLVSLGVPDLDPIFAP